MLCELYMLILHNCIFSRPAVCADKKTIKYQLRYQISLSFAFLNLQLHISLILGLSKILIIIVIMEPQM